jgi:methylenetetrahydrofolate reductase (NADPH)
MIESRDHVVRLARWLRDHSVTDVFVIAGDASHPHGPYDGATAFLRDLLAADPGLERVGVAAYPDGHVAIDPVVVHDAMHAKQAVIRDAGVAGYVATQMCFDASRIVDWLDDERAAGFDLAVQLGVPGPVDRAKLLSMGARLGVGASLRYLRKNRSSLTRMLSFSGYDPSDLIDPIAAHADRLGIVGLHVFTFNNVADTVAWRARSLGQLG